MAKNIKCDCGGEFNIEWTQSISYRVPLNNPKAKPDSIEDSECIKGISFLCPECYADTLNEKQLKQAVKIIEKELPYVYYYVKQELADYDYLVE
jgi:hypothetical protein